jgi:hypothetical protein
MPAGRAGRRSEEMAPNFSAILPLLVRTTARGVHRSLTSNGAKGDAPHAADQRTPQPEFPQRDIRLDPRRRDGTTGATDAHRPRNASRSELENPASPSGELPIASIVH